jgi:hypothetical protein
MEYGAPREPISETHQIGALLAGLGAFLLIRRAMALPSTPRSFDRSICLLLACVLLAYGWAVLMAILARHREWTPQGCHVAGYPLLALALYGVVGGPHAAIIRDTGAWLIMADFSGRLCRRIAFPELGWSGKAPKHPPLSIDPRLHTRPDPFDGRP